jgi:hypothetical protein
VIPMQTFLPYASIEESAACLDWRRLGKQRVEAFQILNVLNGKPSRWANHPAVRMWRGYAPALTYYKNCCIVEWMRRGYRNSMIIDVVESYELPNWFGSPDFHASHRSNLLRKDATYYGKFGWTEPSSLPYIWPV